MNKEARVGLFILGAIIILFYLSVNIGSLRLFSNSYFVYKSYFEDVVGLEKKSPVKISGITVGWVEEISLTDKGKAEVTIRIDRNHTLFKNSYATIAQDSLLGNKILEVDSGESSSGILAPGSTLHLPGRSSASLGEILEGVKDITTSVQEVSHSINRVFAATTGEERMRQSLEDVSKASSNIQSFTLKLDNFMEKNNDRLFSTTKNLDAGIKSFSEFMPDVQNTFGNAKEKFELAMVDLKTSAKNTALATRSARIAVEKIENGQGTIGRLINEDELYEGVKDAVESVNSFLGKAKKLEINIDAHQENYQRLKNSRGELNLELKFNDDYFYIIQLSVDDFGKTSRKKIISSYYQADGVTPVNINLSPNARPMTGHDLAITAPIKEEITFDKTNFKFGFQIAKRFNHITLRAGKFEDNFGCAIDFNVPLKSTNFRWVTSIEAFDFSGYNRENDDRVHVKWWNKTFLFKKIYTYFGIDDMFSRRSAATFYGFGLTFNDDDLKILLYSLIGKQA